MNVVAAVADLFFISRLDHLARQSSVNLTVAQTTQQLTDAIAQAHPALVLVDLGARGTDPGEAIRLSRAAGIAQIIAFGPHKDLAARSAALEAGATEWVTNQRLLETLAELWR